VKQKDYQDMQISLNQPGMHNVQNACAAIAIGRELGISNENIQKALSEFNGVGRRFTRYGEIALPAVDDQSAGHFALVDDYGHHPVEMAATLEAARGAYPDRRLVLAFQPHRYTRTRDLFEDFVRVMSSADVVVLAEVYGAGEAAIVAADGRSLTRALRVLGKVDPVFVENIADFPATLLSVLKDGDVVINMGAGSINSVPAKLIKHINEQ
jgi:UDP-N-acetylmuramate--alanine ligase